MSVRTLGRGLPISLVGLFLIAVVFAVYTGQRASATHQPADKDAAAADNGPDVTFTANGDQRELLEATIKTSKPTDLMLDVSLECEIETLHQWAGPTSSTHAFGRLRVWVEVDDVIVPIESASTPPQNPPPAGSEATDSVSFCERQEDLSRADNDELLLDNTTHGWSRRHRNSNSFVWVRLNTQAGIHRVEVVAEFDEDTSATAGDFADASAAVGKRLLLINPTTMSNDVVIGNPGTS